MSRTMLKVRAEGDIIKVSTYNREIGRKGYFCFLRHDFDGLRLKLNDCTPHSRAFSHELGVQIIRFC